MLGSDAYCAIHVGGNYYTTALKLERVVRLSKRKRKYRSSYRSNTWKRDYLWNKELTYNKRLAIGKNKYLATFVPSLPGFPVSFLFLEKHHHIELSRVLEVDYIARAGLYSVCCEKRNTSTYQGS